MKKDFLKEEFNIVQVVKIIAIFGAVYIFVKILAELGIISGLIEQVIEKI
jgi:hypothetical protein